MVKLNIDEAPEIAARYRAQSIPLLVLVRDGEEVDRHIGAVPPARCARGSTGTWPRPHERRDDAAGRPGWRQTRHDALTRELRLRDFDAALALVNRLAVAAEDHLRRPACA